MRFVRPVDVTDANLVSSSVAETDRPAYSSGTTYAIGNEVILAATHRIYRSTTAGNVGHSPDVSPANWADIGPTSRWAMFDKVIGTRTIGGTTLVVEVMPGLIDFVGLLDVGAATVRIELIDAAGAGTVVFDRTAALDDGDVIVDWYDYFFAPFNRKDTALFLDLPPYSEAKLRITVTDTSPVSVGTLIFGRQFIVGDTEFGASRSLDDYSKKDVNATFGTVTLRKGAFSKTMTLSIVIPTGAFDQIARQFEAIRGTEILFLGTDDLFEAMVIFGWYTSWRQVIKYARESLCALDIKGLT